MEKKENITKNIKAPNQNLEVLKKHFSNCFDKNGNFDFEKFKKELSENDIDFYKESYDLDWLGKSYARLLASDEATTLLKEDEAFNRKDENKDSENLLIKGDNLEVLKHIVHAYYEKIKMIYIDPPYNTGGDDFVYEDNRKFTVSELQELAGVDEDKAKRILKFTQSKSNSHSAWLTFMYPRLYIAKQLLKDDGVIFVSIDDNEVAQLRLLMDEIFGEENFVGQLPTIMNLKGNNDEFGFSGTHEITMVYAKQKDLSELNYFPYDENELEEWDEDNKGYFKKGAPLRATGAEDKREDRPEMFYPILIKGEDVCTIEIDEFKRLYNKETKQFDDDYLLKLKNEYENLGYDFVLPLSNSNYGRWRWGYSPENKKRLKSDIIIIRNGGGITLYKKQRPAIGDLPSKKPKSLLYKPEYNSGNGTAEIYKLFGVKVFSNPKPKPLIKDLITIGANNDDIILDFLAGSATTGDAVMQLNAEDNGNRKYVLVQLPEPIDPQKNKTAYDFVKKEFGKENPTIFEIAKERLIRAAKKIKEETIETKISEKEDETKELESKFDFENKEEKIKELKKEIESLNNQDFGFKIFETTPIWEDYDFEAKELDAQTKLFDESKLTKEDIKALLLTWKTYDGVPLTEDLTIYDLDGYKAYYAKNKLYLVHKGFATKNLKSLLEKIDTDKSFNPTSIIAFGYHFESKNLREITENINSYSNKKNIDIDFITRY